MLKSQIFTIKKLREVLAAIPAEHDDKTVWIYPPDKGMGYPVVGADFSMMTIDNRGSEELSLTLEGTSEDIIDEATKQELDEASTFLATLSSLQKRGIERMLHLRPIGVLDYPIDPTKDFELLAIIKIIKCIPDLPSLYEKKIELDSLMTKVDEVIYGQENPKKEDK